MRVSIALRVQFKIFARSHALVPYDYIELIGAVD